MEFDNSRELMRIFESIAQKDVMEDNHGKNKSAVHPSAKRSYFKQSEVKEAFAFFNDMVKRRSELTINGKKTVSDALESLKSKISDIIENMIRDNPEEYGVEMIDDSDFSREGGYGRYEYPDEGDVKQATIDQTEQILGEIEDDLIKTYLNFKESGYNDIFEWGKKTNYNSDNDEVIIGWSDEIDLGLYMGKSKAPEQPTKNGRPQKKKWMKESDGDLDLDKVAADAERDDLGQPLTLGDIPSECMDYQICLGNGETTQPVRKGGLSIDRSAKKIILT